jgi:small subunit ribosomal protein S18
MSDRAKIRSRRVSGNDSQQQRQVARAIKNAREMGLLAYTSRVTTQRRGGGGGGGGGGGRSRDARSDQEGGSGDFDSGGDGTSGNGDGRRGGSSRSEAAAEA